MSRYKRLKIASKISILVGTFLLVSFVVIFSIILNSIYTNSSQEAKALATEISKNSANQISNTLSNTRTILQNVEDTIVLARKNKTMSRDQINELLEKTLTNSPQIFGLYTLWEPNVFDGSDSSYRNKIGHDATGRFLPYVVRSEGKIVLEPLTGYDKDGAGDYYLIPKKTGKASLIEPYSYKVAGKDILLTSLTVPIFADNGNFMGIVGADIDLTSLQSMVGEIKPMGGYSSLFSGNGTYIADGADPKKVMTNASKQSEAWKSIMDQTTRGKELSLFGNFSADGMKALSVFEPVSLDGIDTFWVFDTVIPNGSILASFYSMLKMIILLSILSLIIILTFVAFTTNRITRPLKEAVSAAEQIALGDLNVTIEVKSQDEIGALSLAFSTMVTSINEVMSNINISSEQVALGSRQVSASSQALSQGTTEQASSIEQLTASMEQISGQTRQNAVHANQANGLSVSATKDAVSGNSHMKEMLKAMEEINDSSVNISKIIKVIDEIAFQTNILALNAAVEAARAGQHGKGFAVVAEEVRNLAVRSANAAKETTAMIEGSIKKVEAGTKIANVTAEALIKIVGGVTEVATLVSNIASASNEQATGISQVNEGIVQISNVIQTNSATAEESAAASQELTSQAELLKVMVGKFKLKTDDSTDLNHGKLSTDIMHKLMSGRQL